MTKKEGWIGVDLDKTLAEYEDGNFNMYHIGKPIPAMVQRVKALIASGYEVRVFTARAGYNDKIFDQVLAVWTKQHLGTALKATNVKDFKMLCLFDDRAIAVEGNTGRILGGELPR